MKQQVNLTKQLFDSNKHLSQVNGFYDPREGFRREDISVHTSVFNIGNVCVGGNLQLLSLEFKIVQSNRYSKPNFTFWAWSTYNGSII